MNDKKRKLDQLNDENLQLNLEELPKWNAIKTCLKNINEHNSESKILIVVKEAFLINQLKSIITSIYKLYVKLTNSIDTESYLKELYNSYTTTFKSENNTNNTLNTNNIDIETSIFKLFNFKLFKYHSTAIGK